MAGGPQLQGSLAFVHGCSHAWRAGAKVGVSFFVNVSFSDSFFLDPLGAVPAGTGLPVFLPLLVLRPGILLS